MRFWLPLLAAEAFSLWLIGHERASDNIDDTQGRAFASLAVAFAFIASDIFMFLVRSW